MKKINLKNTMVSMPKVICIIIVAIALSIGITLSFVNIDPRSLLLNNSFLAIVETSLFFIATETKIGSRADLWLAAKIIFPSSGTFSAPITSYL